MAMSTMTSPRTTSSDVMRDCDAGAEDAFAGAAT